MTAKDDWAKAERAAEHWLRYCGCVAIRRAVRTRFQKIDFFGCDIMGRSKTGATAWVQVTCGESADVAHRRRKLEALPWLKNDNVLILQMKSEQLGRTIAYRFRIHEYRCGKWDVWEVDEPIPREWFKAWKEKSP